MINEKDQYTADVLRSRLQTRMESDFGVSFSGQENSLGRAMLDFLSFVLENTAQMMYNATEQIFPTRVTKPEFLDYLLENEGSSVLEQKPTVLIVGLVSDVYCTVEPYAIKLQSGDVAFWNTRGVEFIQGELTQVEFYEGRLASAGTKFVPGDYGDFWEVSAEVVENLDGSVFLRVPSNITLDTLRVLTLDEDAQTQVWQRRSMFLDSVYDNRHYRVERDSSTNLLRIVSGDGVYGRSFKGLAGHEELAIKLEFMTNGGDVFFSRNEVEIKKVLVDSVDYKQQFNLVSVSIFDRGRIPSFNERKQTLLAMLRRSRGVDGEFRLASLLDYQLYLDGLGLVAAKIELERDTFPNLQMMNRMNVTLKPLSYDLVFPEQTISEYFAEYGLVTLNYNFLRCEFEVVVPQVYLATGLFTEANVQRVKARLLEHLSVDKLGFDEELTEYTVSSKVLADLPLGNNVQVRWKVVHNWGEPGEVVTVKGLNCTVGVVINLTRRPVVGSLRILHGPDKVEIPLVEGSIFVVDYETGLITVNPTPTIIEDVEIQYVAVGDSLFYQGRQVPLIGEAFGVEVKDLNELL